MKIVLIVTISLFSIVCSGREAEKIKTIGDSRFLVKAGLPYYINKPGLRHLGGKDYLNARNTLGYTFELAYEYTSRKNVNWHAGIGYGMQKTDLKWTFNARDFDPGLKDYVFDYRFAPTAHFWFVSLAVGYDYRLPGLKGTVLQTKAGLGFASFFTGYDERVNVVLNYRDAYGNDRTEVVAFIDADAGTDLHENSSVTFDGGFAIDVNPFYCFYVGIKQPVQWGKLKACYIGISYTATPVVKKDSWGFDLTRSEYFNSAGRHEGMQFYDNRFRSISLQLGVGI